MFASFLSVRLSTEKTYFVLFLLPEFHLWLKEIPLAKLQKKKKKKFIFRSIDRSSSSAPTPEFNLQLTSLYILMAFTTSAQASMNLLFVFLSALLSSKNLLKWIQFGDSGLKIFFHLTNQQFFFFFFFVFVTPFEFFSFQVNLLQN